jgi:MATE family multidrug resistance protein
MMLNSRFKFEIKQCLFLAIPLAAAQLAQSATTFVDTVMMGLLGSQALAAGGLGAATFGLLQMIATGIVSAVSPLTAEAYGARKLDRIGKVLCQGLWLALLLAIPLTMLIWNGGYLLHLLGQKPETVALTETYLQAIAWGYFPCLGFAVLHSFVSALSQPRPVMIIVIGGTLVNMVGNYLLMFGQLGLPKLGLAGIGWASTLSFWSMFMALLIYILCQSQLQRYNPFPNLRKFENPIFWELLKIGLPIGAMIGVETALFSASTFLMGHLSTRSLAAHQIVFQTAFITFNVPLGIGLATTIRVGQLMGQRKAKAARLAGAIGIGMGATFMAAMALIFLAIPDQVISLYLNINLPENRPVVTLAKHFLGVAAVFQVMDGIQVVAAGALRGMKDTRIPMLIAILAYWGVGLTSSYCLGFSFGFGGVGLWWGLALGLSVAAMVLCWRFFWYTREILAGELTIKTREAN